MVCTVKRLVWSIALVIPLGATAADVYRSVDEDGIVVYSDRPSKNSEVIRIITSGSSSSRTSSPATSAAGTSGDATSNSPIVAEIPRESTAEEIAADRSRNCKLARQRVDTYSVARRLYRTGPDGEREYLNDDEIEKEKARAEADVAQWCD